VLAGWLLGGAWLAACVSALVLMTAPAARAADSAAGVLEECRDAADPPVVRR
jgi:hypothetical protein